MRGYSPAKFKLDFEKFTKKQIKTKIKQERGKEVIAILDLKTKWDKFLNKNTKIKLKTIPTEEFKAVGLALREKKRLAEIIGFSGNFKKYKDVINLKIVSKNLDETLWWKW